LTGTVDNDRCSHYVAELVRQPNLRIKTHPKRTFYEMGLRDRA